MKEFKRTHRVKTMKHVEQGGQALVQKPHENTDVDHVAHVYDSNTARLRKLAKKYGGEVHMVGKPDQHLDVNEKTYKAIVKEMGTKPKGEK